MKKSAVQVWSYIIGFVLSVAVTIVVYILVTRHALPMQGLTYTISALAIVQLIIQLIFFLHIGGGDGARWKIVTFAFAVIIVFIVVGGSLWIMNNLNYNMMKMSPAQQAIYMKDNEGL
jgi:cytochrome o ubiquinol oxidase operon protein cyoD